MSKLAYALIVVALMKIFCATVVTRYFFVDPGSSRSLAQTSPAPKEFAFFKGVNKAFYLLPLGLGVGAVSIYFALKPAAWTTFVGIVTVLGTFVTMADLSLRFGPKLLKLPRAS